ncbi:hypothetical protein [Micromonospora carbonacea]|uniref:hypothetical protein n=1 Tax=Micromonospora carbonacea TaxID=47853 RepID=UPI003718DA84
MIWGAAVVLSMVSIPLRVAYIAAFLASMSSTLRWVRAALVIDVGLAVALGLRGVSPSLPVVFLWVATAAFDVSFLILSRRVLRRDAELQRSWDLAQLVAGLPEADREWARAHLDLATVRLADRREVRRG